MNCFEKRIKAYNIMAVAGCIILPASIIALIFTLESDWFILPLLLLCLSSIPLALGFSFRFMIRIQYKMAKALFTDAEIMEIERPMFLDAAIAEKAKRLMADGKTKGDMSAYNEFRELVMLSKPAGFGYGRYGTFM